MFGLLAHHKAIAYGLEYYISNLEILAFVVAFLCATPLCKNFLNIAEKHKIYRTLVNIWLMILFIFSTSSIAASTYNPFIYFRF
jgi:alginate O-acetyltransferase complex protein AlgI